MKCALFLALLWPSTVFAASGFEEAEQVRIRAHLRRAETTARQREVTHLSPTQRARRANVLEVLARYREAGRFPKNTQVPGRSPVFVDHEGARCAVAALIENSGHRALVQRIARTANLAFVQELAREEEFVRWLKAHGLTLEEAAAIQPSYTECTSLADAYCPREPAEDVVRMELLEGDATRGTGRFEVQEVLKGQRFSVGEEIQARINGARIAEVQSALGVPFTRTGPVRPLGLRGQEAFLVADPCEVGLGLPLQEALEVLSSPDCVDALERRDPRWAGSWCVSINDPEPSCPSAPDAGPPGLPTLDAGLVDASLASEEPASCRSTEGLTGGWGGLLLGLLLLGIRRRTT